MKNKKLSRAIGLAVAIMMLFSVCAVGNVSAYYACGDDFNYIRDENEMKITGVLISNADITIPEEINGYPVTEISDLAFMGCDTIVNLTIPYTVKEIGDRAFSTCSSLESITVDENNPYFCSVDGVLFDKEMTEIIQYPAAKQGDSYTVPQGVTEIEDTAFRECDLVQITLPSSLEEIGYGAFEISEKLESIEIPEGVKSIDMEAFFYCTALKEVKLPKSIRSIHNSAFMSCTALESVEVDRENEIYTGEDGVLFVKNTGKLVLYPAGRTQTEYTVPNGITELGDNAFSGCVYLQEVTLPESVQYLCDYAFFGCTGLKSINIPRSVIWIADCAFYNCSSLEDVYYSGIQSQWNEIEIEYGNDALQNARIHFEEEPEVPAVTCILGDANSDGKVNVKDATMVQKSAASLVILDQVQTLGADCDGNNQVNVRDATAIQKYCAGIATGLAIGRETTK